MFLRALSKQAQPQISYVQARCLRRHFSDEGDIRNKGGKTVKEAMDKRAREFMENLDDELLKRKQNLEYMIEQYRCQNYPIPNEMTDRNWWELLNQSPTRRSYVKCLQRLHERENEKKKKAIKIMEKLRLLEENEAMHDHLYHLSKERDIQIILWKKNSAMLSEIPVIIDLDFPGLYQKEERKVMENIRRALKSNAFHLQPLSFNITSCKNNLRLLDFENADRSVPGGYFHEQHYLDLFPPQQLVYLSPDGPPLDALDTNCTYIVGGIGNVAGRSLETLSKAKEQGIRCASFPLFVHGRLNKNKNLSIYESLEIVRSMYYWHSWKSAFTECFTPDRYIVYPSNVLPRKKYKKTRKYQMK